MLASHESLALEVRVVLLRERCTLKDGQNSVRKVVDTAGSVVASYDYDAWGNTLSDPNAIDVLFHHRAFGEVHDPDLGMTYLRARWMDPGTGRFESRDPFGGDEADPHTLHRYLFAVGSPVFFWDPSGEESEPCPFVPPIGPNRKWVGTKVHNKIFDEYRKQRGDVAVRSRIWGGGKSGSAFTWGFPDIVDVSLHSVWEVKPDPQSAAAKTQADRYVKGLNSNHPLNVSPYLWTPPEYHLGEVWPVMPFLVQVPGLDSMYYQFQVKGVAPGVILYSPSASEVNRLATVAVTAAVLVSIADVLVGLLAKLRGAVA